MLEDQGNSHQWHHSGIVATYHLIASSSAYNKMYSGSANYLSMRALWHKSTEDHNSDQFQNQIGPYLRRVNLWATTLV